MDVGLVEPHKKLFVRFFVDLLIQLHNLSFELYSRSLNLQKKY